MLKRAFAPFPVLVGVVVIVIALIGIWGYERYRRPLPLVEQVPYPNAPANTAVENFRFAAATTETSNDQNGRQIGYIKSVATDSGAYSLNIDYVQWLSCTAADCPEPYRVVNDNPRIRTFPIAQNATVELQTYSHQSTGPDAGNFNYNQSIPLNTFASIFNHPDSAVYPAHKLLYWITLKNGVITNIEEQYQP